LTTRAYESIVRQVAWAQGVLTAVSRRIQGPEDQVECIMIFKNRSERLVSHRSQWQCCAAEHEKSDRVTMDLPFAVVAAFLDPGWCGTRKVRRRLF